MRRISFFNKIINRKTNTRQTFFVQLAAQILESNMIEEFFEFGTTPMGALILVLITFVFVNIDNLEGLHFFDKVSSSPRSKGPWRLPLLGNNHQLLLNYSRRLEYIFSLRKEVCI